jgi:hypothetical protein
MFVIINALKSISRSKGRIFSSASSSLLSPPRPAWRWQSETPQMKRKPPWRVTEHYRVYYGRHAKINGK